MLWISCGSLIMALIECVYRYYQFPPYYNLSQMHNLKDVIGYVVSRISAPVWSMLSLVLWGILILLMIRAVKSRQSYRRMTEAISTTEQELKRTEQEYRSMSILRHDYRNMIGCVQKLLQEGKTDEAQRFLTSVQQDMLSDTELLKCSSAPVNAVINAKLGDASDIASTCRITASIPEELEYDLSMILANLLDNAIRASRKLTSGREIRVSITETDGYLQLTVKNRIAASVLSANPRLLTDKEDASQHGLGLQSVRMLAQRHEGMLDLYEENSMFVASVLLMKPSHGGQNGHMGVEPLHT
ncbi:MAG: GHKL domain-containing protein [Oscillospiraceae bacterium]|nr:GHKL domain-containing protein [Oscillospiraceae bacterium]